MADKLAVGSSFAPIDSDIVCEVESTVGKVVVSRMTNNEYLVTVQGIVRHPHCEAEAVMRALATYLMVQNSEKNLC